MHRRLNVVRHWVFGKRNGVSITDLIKVILLPPTQLRGKAKIRRVQEAERHFVVHFKDIQSPLYYPREMGLYPLYLTTAELSFPELGHCYETKWTQVAPDDVVVDCGAAEGLFTLMVASRCRKVYAIEPLPSFVEALRLTFHSFPNVEVMPLALSDFEGEAMLRDQGWSSRLDEGSGGIQVKVSTLDALFHERNIPISFIKADLEGHELHMLRGAVETIRQYKPKMAITAYDHPDHPKLISDFIRHTEPRYKIAAKGIEASTGQPMMVYAWVEGAR